MPKKQQKRMKFFGFFFGEFLPGLGLKPTPQDARLCKDTKDGNRARHKPKGQRKSKAKGR